MPRRSTPETEGQKLRQYARLLQNAVPGNATMEGFQALADFLSKDQYFQPVENMLKAFDAPVPPFGLLIIPQGQAALVSSSIFECVPLFRSLIHARKRSPRLERYLSQCLRMALDRWTSILRWMTYLVTHTTQLDGHRGLVQACADALYAILVDLTNDPDLIKQGLWFTHGTAKLIYLLLLQVDKQTGKYLILRIFDVPGAECSMAQLFQEAFEDSSTWPVMWLEWKSQPSHLRRKFSAALIGRIQQLVDILSTHNVAEVILAIRRFVTATTTLVGDTEGRITQDLERQGFLFEYASALAALANKLQHLESATPECWREIALAMSFLVSFVLYNSANPSRYMPRLIKGGILRCASLCLRWDPPNRQYGDSSTVMTLQWILPFLTRADVHAMVEELHDFDYFRKAKGDPELSPNAERICQEISLAALRGHQVTSTKAKAMLSICSNTKHTESVGQIKRSDDAPIKACGRCHSVFYCSAACQTEDWTLFHSQECGYLEKVYEFRNSHQEWTHLSGWLDRLRLVEILANHYLPPLPEYLTNPAAEFRCTDTQNLKVASLRTYPQGTSVSIFDLVTFDNPWPMDFHKVALNTVRYTWRQINHVWDNRIQRYVQDMLDEPDKYALVEGVFPFHDKDSMFVLAKMKYDPDAPDGERYSVVNSAFRTGKRQLKHIRDAPRPSEQADTVHLPIVLTSTRTMGNSSDRQ